MAQWKFFGLFAALFCPPAPAWDPRDLTGVWIIEPQSPAGLASLQALTLTEGKGGLTGELKTVTAQGDLDRSLIGEFKKDGDAFSFKAGKIELWRGRLVNRTELRMTMYLVREGGSMPDHRDRFRRSSTAELARLRAGLPGTLVLDRRPLPKPHDLPANGLAQTPPMGWSSWSQFYDTTDDRIVRETADALVSTGLRDAGYTLVEIDDGWQGVRDQGGALHPNAKFPDMKALADYVHSKSLQFGIYTSFGALTCGGYLGSHGYEEQDARTFAQWGVDFVMNDGCSPPYTDLKDKQALYQKMGEALRATRRPIVYKVHDRVNFVATNPATWGQAVKVESWGRAVGANLWRTGVDLCVGDRWKAVSDRFERHGNAEDAGPGGWNDADTMVIGQGGVLPENRGLTPEESRTHMTLWSMLASPLVLGNDVRTMVADTKSILLNREVIAVDQDPLGKQGRRIVKWGLQEVWEKPLAGGAMAVALFNRDANEADIAVSWADLGLKSGQRTRDLWHHADLGERAGGYSARVPAHGSVLLRLQRAENRRRAPPASRLKSEVRAHDASQSHHSAGSDG